MTTGMMTTGMISGTMITGMIPGTIFTAKGMFCKRGSAGSAASP